MSVIWFTIARPCSSIDNGWSWWTILPRHQVEMMVVTVGKQWRFSWSFKRYCKRSLASPVPSNYRGSTPIQQQPPRILTTRMTIIDSCGYQPLSHFLVTIDGYVTWFGIHHQAKRYCFNQWTVVNELFTSTIICDPDQQFIWLPLILLSTIIMADPWLPIAILIDFASVLCTGDRCRYIANIFTNIAKNRCTTQSKNLLF